MKNLYLAAAIVGTIAPYVFFIDFMDAAGVDLIAFVSALFVNGASGGLTADILISSVVFWIYMFAAGEGPRPWIFIVLNLAIGLSCALPAYLYVLESRKGRRDGAAAARPA